PLRDRRARSKGRDLHAGNRDQESWTRRSSDYPKRFLDGPQRRSVICFRAVLRPEATREIEFHRTAKLHGMWQKGGLHQLKTIGLVVLRWGENEDQGHHCRGRRQLASFSW